MGALELARVCTIGGGGGWLHMDVACVMQGIRSFHVLGWCQCFSLYCVAYFPFSRVLKPMARPEARCTQLPDTPARFAAGITGTLHVAIQHDKHPKAKQHVPRLFRAPGGARSCAPCLFA